jgi:tRNA(fMet)-specific endonuclease VapC
VTDAYLLDTNVASIAWDGGSSKHHIIRQRISDLNDDPIFICPISAGEVEYGLRVSPAVDAERHRVMREAMKSYSVLNIDHHTGEVYGYMRGELFKLYASRDKKDRLKEKQPEQLKDAMSAKELGIQENDLWIVSVAVQYNVRLITMDEKMKRVLDVAESIFAYNRAIMWTLPTNS